jgi:hypothetical protein
MLQSILIITGNYSKDLAAAKDAGLFSKGAMPKKADLYAAIDAANNELNAVAESCGLEVDAAIELQDSEYLESIDDTPLPDRAIGREIDLDDVPVSQSVRDGLNDLFKRSADMAKGSHVITPKGSHTIDQNGLTAAPIELSMVGSLVPSDDSVIQKSIAYANALSKKSAADLHAQWTAQQQQRTAGKVKVTKQPVQVDIRALQEVLDGLTKLTDIAKLDGKMAAAQSINKSVSHVIKHLTAFKYLQEPAIKAAFLNGSITLGFIVQSTAKAGGKNLVLDRVKELQTV